MYTICPACGTEVTFMVNQCPVCARVLNVFDFHRGDSPDIAYQYNFRAPIIYVRGVITNIENSTVTETTYYSNYTQSSKDRDYVNYQFTYLYHGRWYSGTTGDSRDYLASLHYEIGDDVIVMFQRGAERRGIIAGRSSLGELVRSII